MIVDTQKVGQLLHPGDDRHLFGDQPIHTAAPGQGSFNHSWMVPQWVCMLWWTSGSWAHSSGATSVGSGPSGRSRLSASECARSVLRTSVRCPSSAARTAVAAAIDVLPTPPLPVYTMMRIPSDTRATDDWVEIHPSGVLATVSVPRTASLEQVHALTLECPAAPPGRPVRAGRAAPAPRSLASWQSGRQRASACGGSAGRP